MKVLILSILLLFSVGSQRKQLQAEYMATRFCNEVRECEEWSSWEPTTVIIVVDLNKEILIFSQYEQKYTIVSKIEEFEDDNVNIIRMDALDISGIRCTLELLHFKNKGDHLYIRWSNFQIVYQIKKV